MATEEEEEGEDDDSELHEPLFQTRNAIRRRKSSRKRNESHQMGHKALANTVYNTNIASGFDAIGRKRSTRELRDAMKTESLMASAVVDAAGAVEALKSFMQAQVTERRNVVRFKA